MRSLATLFALSAAVALAAACTSASPEVPRASDSPARPPRVVVIAVDGLGAERLAAGIADGSFPNLGALAAQGSLHRVRGLPGLDTPSVWTTLLTGASPARTGVVGYVTRRNSSRGPVPAIGHLKYEDVPLSAAPAGAVDAGLRALEGAAIPRTATTNGAPFVWELAARAGVESVALRAPLAIDRAPVDGASVLFGEGYPDAYGALGDWMIYTSAPLSSGVRHTGTAGTLRTLEDRGGYFAAAFPGPVDHLRVAELKAKRAKIEEALADPAVSYEESLDLIGEQRAVADELDALRAGLALEIAITTGDGAASVRIGDEEQRVSAGAWSAPYHLTFELSGGVTLHATTRVKLLALEPELRLYVHRLDVDPAAAPFWQPASSPASFAAELAAAHGTFETYGWTTATMGYKDGELDAATVIESASRNLASERAMLAAELADPSRRLVVAAFRQPMHLAHALTHLADREHPRHDPAEAASIVVFLDREIRADRAVDASLAAIDAIAGETRAALGESDALLVVSPHGAAPFRRQLHLNNWLAANGFLATGDATRSHMLGYVDWSGTRAYAVGLGAIYVNLAGREPAGVVAEADAAALLDELERELLAARDPETGARMVLSVHRPRALFDGPHADELADLVVGLAPPYRVSWSTTLGGIALDEAGALAPVVAVNDQRWTGDCVSVDPASIEGVLVTSVALDARAGTALDERELAPTVLALLGVEQPAEMELAALPRR